MLNSLATTAMTSYVNYLSVDQPAPTAPGTLGTKINLLMSYLAWAGTTAGVAGVIVCGIMMALSHKRGESSEHMGRLGVVLGGCILVATAGPIVTLFA